MRHIETNTYDVKRLLHVKGNKRVTAKEVCQVFLLLLLNHIMRQRGPWWRSAQCFDMFQVEMSWKSFNLGDVFLLDIGKTIIQWNGPKSNSQERLKVTFVNQSYILYMSLLSSCK